MLAPSSWPFCATHRANSYCSPGPPSVCRHSTPLHAPSGGLRQGLWLAPGGLHPSLTKRLLASFLLHLQALGAVDVETSLGLGAEIPCRVPLCQQPPVRPQPGPSLVPATVSSGSSGVTAPLPQGPDGSRASGVDRRAEGGLRAGPVLQPSVHRPPRRPRRRSCSSGFAGPDQAHQHASARATGDGCPGTGQGSGPTPELRVTDGAGLAGGGKRPPCSPGARRRWPPRACALARPCAPSRRRDRKASAAIWWRRPGSCGAERGGRVRGGRPLSGAPRSPSRKTHLGSPTPLPPGAAPIPKAEGNGWHPQRGSVVQWSAPGL